MPLAGFETFFVEHPSQTDNRIQFINRPVGVDARRILGHSFATDQSSFALVTGARIDFGDANSHGFQLMENG